MINLWVLGVTTKKDMSNSQERIWRLYQARLQGWKCPICKELYKNKFHGPKAPTSVTMLKVAINACY